MVGTVGSLSETKNQEVLIRAAAMNSKIKVLIAGIGPLEEKLKKLIDSLSLQNRVFLVGQRTDIPQFLQALDVFTLPSKTEGTSLALLEAMAARLPVVATDVGGNSELVVHNKTGLLVPSDNVQELNDAISWTALNREKARKMGVDGRARVDQIYSFSKTAAIYSKVFLTSSS